MRLARECIIDSLLLKCSILTINVGINLLLLVVLQPVALLLEFLLQKHVSLPIGIHILQQVNLCLVLSSPLLLSCLPNLVALLGNQSINHSLVGLLVTSHLIVVTLELLDLLSTRKSLISLQLLHCFLTGQSIVQQILVSHSVLVLGLLSQLLLGGVVRNELKIALTVQQESLLSVGLLLLFLYSPLGAEHGLFLLDELGLLLSLEISGVLLPVQDSHGVLNLLLLLPSLCHFSLLLLLGVEGPKLSIDLLFDHLLLNLASLVNELLLALNGRSIVVELLVLIPQRVICHLELHVLSPLHFGLTFSLSLTLQVGQSLEHLLTDLLWSLHIIVKFLFIDSILGFEECSKSGLSLLEV